MFVLVAGEPSHGLESTIRAMAAKLIVAQEPAVTRVWFDLATGLAVAGGSAGTLPEDIFDRQPYVDEETCFLADGRVSNRAEIADQLGISAAEQSQMSDSEILYRAFLRWGEQSAKWLSGSYSFCAVDRRTLRVVALTDHVASSSVLYARTARSLIVSNQMGAILANAEIDPEPDIPALALLVAPRRMRERTSITSVHLLQGGCSLHYEGGTASTRRWWDPQDVEQVRYRHSDQYVEHALELFQSAIAAHLRSPGQISVMMSGGLDSTLVAAIAATQARALGREVTTYTSVPEPGVATSQRLNWDADEIAESRSVVALHPNMRHVLVAPRGRTALDYLPRIHSVSHTAPSAITNLVWIESINDLAQQAGGRIMLTGSNGNAGISLTGDAVFGTLFADRRFLTALRLARPRCSPGWGRHMACAGPRSALSSRPALARTCHSKARSKPPSARDSRCCKRLKRADLWEYSFPFSAHEVHHRQQAILGTGCHGAVRLERS